MEQVSLLKKTTTLILSILMIGSLILIQKTHAKKQSTGEQIIIASDGMSDDFFGSSVAMSGDYAVVGAYGDDDDPTLDVGSVYVYKRNSETGAWEVNQKIIASDGVANDEFGNAVSIDGNYILVGAHWDDDNGDGSGAAYIFERNSETGVWEEKTKLLAADGGIDDEFGYSVAISNDYAVVGSAYDDDNGNEAGAAYVFERNSETGVWEEKTKLLAADGEANDYFGRSVAISEDYALVGAPWDDDDGDKSGAAYVFERNSGTGVWLEGSKLAGSSSGVDTYFGWSVGIDGDYLISSALEDTNQTDVGVAYIFKRDNTSFNPNGTGVWNEEERLFPSDGDDFDFFAYSVGISNDYAIAGASKDDDNKLLAGSAYVYERTESGWNELKKIVPMDGVEGDEFGHSVSISGNNLMVGTHLKDVNLKDEAGGAYFYEIREMKLAQGKKEAFVQKIMGTNTNASDALGQNLFIDTQEKYLMISSYHDDEAMGIYNAGAFYIYDLENGKAVNGQKIMASDPADSDRLSTGGMVVENNIAAVGTAHRENGGTAKMGIVYIFEKNQSNGLWEERQKLLSSTQSPGERFGKSVTMRNGQIIVGASRDSSNGISEAGLVYVFELNEGTQLWEEKQILYPTGNSFNSGSRFGREMKIQGDDLFISAPNEGSGYIYVYHFNEGTGLWEEGQRIGNSGGDTYTYYGYEFSVHGDTLAVGSKYNDNENGDNAGAVFVFHYNPSNQLWEEVQKITANDGEVDEKFGMSVSVYGDYMVVSSYDHTDPILSNAGAAYLLKRDGDGIWNEVRKIMPDTIVADDDLGAGVSQLIGTSVELSKNHLVVSDIYDDESAKNAGAAYLYRFFDLVPRTVAKPRCPLNPVRMNVTRELEASPNGNGGQSVEISWKPAWQVQDSLKERRAKLVLEYLKKHPESTMGASRVKTKEVVAQHVINRMKQSEEGVWEEFKNQLVNRGRKNPKMTLDVLKPLGLGKLFDGWWGYLLMNRIEEDQSFGQAFMVAMSAVVENDSIQGIDVKGLGNRFFGELSKMTRKPVLINTVQCINRSAYDLSLEKILPSVLFNELRENAALKAKLKTSVTTGNLHEVMNVLKASDSIRKAVSKWQEEGVVDQYFDTGDGKEVERCIKHGYKRALKLWADKIRAELILEGMEDNEEAEENFAEKADLVLNLLEDIQENGGHKTSEMMNEVLSSFVKDIKLIEKVAGVDIVEVSNGESLSRYHDNALLRENGSGFSEGMITEVWRGNELIHVEENPNIKQFTDENVPLNHSGRVRYDDYYVVSRTQCASREGNHGKARIDPLLKEGDVLKVDVKIKLSEKEALMYKEGILEVQLTDQSGEKLTLVPEKTTNGYLLRIAELKGFETYKVTLKGETYERQLNNLQVSHASWLRKQRHAFVNLDKIEDKAGIPYSQLKTIMNGRGLHGSAEKGDRLILKDAGWLEYLRP